MRFVVTVKVSWVSCGMWMAHGESRELLLSACWREKRREEGCVGLI